MADPIGISFIPREDTQPFGAQQGQAEGNLAQAFKILRLQLPRVVGAQAFSPNTLLQSPGSQGLQGQAGFNPYAALFEALIKASQGQPTAGPPTSGPMPVSGAPPMAMGRAPTSSLPTPPAPPMPQWQAPAPPMRVPVPNITPGDLGNIGQPAPNPSPTFHSWLGNERRLGSQGY